MHTVSIEALAEAASTGITNLDVVKQISSYLAKTMGSKERQKRLENDHARHTLASRKVQAGKVKTRLDLIKVGDGSFGCVWCVCCLMIADNRQGLTD